MDTPAPRATVVIPCSGPGRRHAVPYPKELLAVGPGDMGTWRSIHERSRRLPLGLVSLSLSLLLAMPAPALAYGDPTGGVLFQLLLPILGALWGVWLIVAGRARQAFATVLRRLRRAIPFLP